MMQLCFLAEKTEASDRNRVEFVWPGIPWKVGQVD
jgi:hypothetical protein